MGASARIGVIVAVAAGLAVFAGACGEAEPAESGDTLPLMNTTTTTTTSTVPPTTRPKTYEIQQGESLSAIAERFGLDWTVLAKFNKIKEPDDIEAGQVIKLPPVTVPKDG